MSSPCSRSSRRLEILVCVNRRANPWQPSCAARGGEAIAEALEAAVAARSLPVTITRIHCLGRCDHGPNLRIAPAGPFHHHVRPEDLPGILEDLDPDSCSLLPDP